MAEIESLIVQTESWWRFHKARGVPGRIEALACQIRLKALREALKALADEGGAPP